LLYLANKNMFKLNYAQNRKIGKPNNLKLWRQ